MACPDCHRRAALIAALAPAITRLSLRRDALLGLLGLPNARLLRAAKIENPHELLRRLSHVAAPFPSESIPTSLCHHDPDYPEALAQLDSTPAVLHATCTTERLRELLTGPTVAILGDIAHTDYAQRITFALAHDLATAGVTLLGGLYGLEKTALHAALHADGHTIGVMPGGAERPLLIQHAVLHQRIQERGAAISEFPLGFFPPEKWCFVASQRLTAALASIVVVVEARRKSIALFTAQIANDLGGDVAVTPREVTQPGGQGLFSLLRDGAHPVACAQDVLDLIPMAHTTEHRAQKIPA